MFLWNFSRLATHLRFRFVVQPINQTRQLFVKQRLLRSVAVILNLLNEQTNIQKNKQTKRNIGGTHKNWITYANHFPVRSPTARQLQRTWRQATKQNTWEASAAASPVESTKKSNSSPAGAVPGSSVRGASSRSREVPSAVPAASHATWWQHRHRTVQRVGSDATKTYMRFVADRIIGCFQLGQCLEWASMQQRLTPIQLSPSSSPSPSYHHHHRRRHHRRHRHRHHPHQHQNLISNPKVWNLRLIATPCPHPFLYPEASL